MTDGLDRDIIIRSQQYIIEKRRFFDDDCARERRELDALHARKRTAMLRHLEKACGDVGHVFKEQPVIAVWLLGKQSAQDLPPRECVICGALEQNRKHDAPQIPAPDPTKVPA